MATSREYPARSYYDLLEVTSSASRGQIRLAYLRLIEEARSATVASNDRVEALNEAFEVLMDPESRTAYDQYLARASLPRPANSTAHRNTARSTSPFVESELPARTAKQKPGSITGPRRRKRRRFAYISRQPMVWLWFWLIAALLSAIFALKFAHETEHWTQYWHDSDPNGTWKWLASIGLWIVAGISVWQIWTVIRRR